MSEELDFPMSSQLLGLTDRQLDHLSVGLELNFGTQLAGNSGDPEDFALLLESGRVVALHARTLTVQDVWQTAEALSR